MCGLLELASLETDAGARRELQTAARRDDPRLAHRRTTRRRSPRTRDALLLHGVYDLPKDIGVDEGTLWGDYFYLEALMRGAPSATGSRTGERRREGGAVMRLVTFAHAGGAARRADRLSEAGPAARSDVGVAGGASASSNSSPTTVALAAARAAVAAAAESAGDCRSPRT